MSDKRVTFETAKLASNVGFDSKTGSPDYMVNGNEQDFDCNTEKQ